MKLGLLLHPERGVDAVLAEAHSADQQGYDSVWVSDHLMEWRGNPGPDLPLDSFTLMTAVGAVTSRTRLAWAMLNPSFRPPAVLAKMLATLDQITHGRVICTAGAGWFEEEYRAYDLPFVEDHDERIAAAAEALRLMCELWTHPAPERVSFEGKYVRASNLAFAPAPWQKPHPPIWFGGDSEATQRVVRELADGWVMLRTAPDALRQALASPDWPSRPMTLVRNSRIVVGATRDEALATVGRMIEQHAEAQAMPASVEEFLQRFIAGNADECLQQLDAVEATGINYLRLAFEDAEQQARVAREILPRLTCAGHDR
jgi:alkanesulfonate monooxygenase SsuD/methylene tetrahydromethanopterin reductase-like flavin-dependent oxidoreductase (luciferase family)